MKDLDTEVLALEGQYLKFDYTYRAVGNIWVARRPPATADGDQGERAENQTDNKPDVVELSYVLGTVFGTTGLVLSTLVCATEKMENMEACFRSCFRKTGVPPKQICVDDWEKWHSHLQALLLDVFGPEPGFFFTVRHWFVKSVSGCF